MSTTDAQPQDSGQRPEKRRAASLLRDYYGLSSAGGQSPINQAESSQARKVDLKELLQKHNMSELLRKESALITEIRELDGERQSLVYNHHHELVAASDTIRNMKLKSESLDPSLEALKTSFAAMSSLSNNLEALHRDHRRQGSTSEQIDLVRDLEPIVTLPSTLADLCENRLEGPNEAATSDNADQTASKKLGLARAERLWTLMETVLAAWADAGVPGVREIAAECRSILKEGRKTVTHLSSL